jgi:serine phosphatase RsbU (regulator of sigma subunit)
VPSLQGWQINPYYHPAREVGGDFYDFHLLSEDRLGVVVGDATGKGVPAALVMASARSMLRALAQASNSPGEVLRRVNDALVTDIPPTCSSPASTPSWSPRAAP